MRPIAFTDARVIDPASGTDGPATLLVKEGRVADLLGPSDAIPADAVVRRCHGRVIAPGLVDTRVFSGEPGAEHRESLSTLGASAAAGGVTTVVVMPDTKPVLDEAAIVAFVLATGKRSAPVRIEVAAALTVSLEGTALAELGLMTAAGAVCVSQGRRAVSDPAVLRRALRYAADLGILTDLTPREPHLSKGVAGSTLRSGWLGLPSVPDEAETVAILRDLELARGARAPINIAGVSLERSLTHMKRAKDEGIDATCSISVNHLSLNETDVGDYRTFFRLEPPLRTEEQRQAMVEGLRDGTIDMVMSGHDPQDADTKRVPYADATPGAIGLETMLGALLRLHHSEEVPLTRIIESVTAAPSRRFGLEAGTLAVGRPADLAIIDLDEPWVVQEEDIVSRSRNTTFENARFQGRVVETWVGGECVFALSPDERP